jgi:hypothetical protein
MNRRTLPPNQSLNLTEPAVDDLAARTGDICRVYILPGTSDTSPPQGAVCLAHQSYQCEGRAIDHAFRYFTEGVGVNR